MSKLVAQTFRAGCPSSPRCPLISSLRLVSLMPGVPHHKQCQYIHSKLPLPGHLEAKPDKLRVILACPARLHLLTLALAKGML